MKPTPSSHRSSSHTWAFARGRLAFASAAALGLVLASCSDSEKSAATGAESNRIGPHEMIDISDQNSSRIGPIDGVGAGLNDGDTAHLEVLELDEAIAELAAVQGTEKLVSYEVTDALVAGGPDGAASLTEALNASRSYPEKRHQLANALGLNGSPEAMQSIAEHLHSEADPQLRRELAESAFSGLSGDDQVTTEMLTSMLAATDDPAILEPATDALSRLADQGTVQFLSELYQQDDPEIEGQQERAITALTQLRNEDAVPALSDLLTTSGDETLVTSAADALIKTGTPSALEAVIEAVSDSEMPEGETADENDIQISPMIRSAILQMLGNASILPAQRSYVSRLTSDTEVTDEVRRALQQALDSSQTEELAPEPEDEKLPDLLDGDDDAIDESELNIPDTADRTESGA